MSLAIDRIETGATEGGAQPTEGERSVGENPVDKLIAKEGLGSGEIERDRLRRERQNGM